LRPTTLTPDAVIADNAAESRASRVETLANGVATRASNSQLALCAILATVGMLFAGFASAYLVRREGLDWVQVQLPSILIVNTIVLLASSATVELSRSALLRERSRSAVLWAATTSFLGLLFLAGQFVAWEQLRAQGVYLPSDPYSSFFYMLTAAHGLHLLGGIIVLTYMLWRVARSQSDREVTDVFSSCAAYWHFVGGVWVLLYLLMRLY
jgi:cytochrome c oxidase subunit 3